MKIHYRHKYYLNIAAGTLGIDIIFIHQKYLLYLLLHY